MSDSTKFLLSDGTTPAVGDILCRANNDARHTFLKVVKVNRKSLICQMVVAHTVRNADGSLYGVAPGAQYGWLHVTAGEAYGNTFKLTTVDFTGWGGTPIPAHRIDLNGYTGNNTWFVHGVL